MSRIPNASKTFITVPIRGSTLTGQGLIEALVAEVCFPGNRCHTLGSSDVADGFHKERRVVFFQRCLQILNDRLVIGEKLSTVPRSESFLAHVFWSELGCYLSGTSYVLLLTRFITATKQDYHDIAVD